MTHTAAALRLDGVLDEPAWLSADSISDFRQTDPAEGQPATERTVVRLLAAPGGLWIGVWAYDDARAPGAIRHTVLQRDADFDADDYVTVMLDPLRDRRNGYLFSVNPNGTLWDAQILSFEDENSDWNGVWDARACITSFGWTAELVIPWQTLRYRGDRDVWGVNFLRQIRRKNEEVLWRAWRRTEGLLFLPHEGSVAGFSGLPRRALAELRPYAAVTGREPERQYPPDGPDSVLSRAATSLKGGVDAKLAVAPTLTLDLTANTDFAQVEADNQVINLTRFPLLFPEKRPFFLESSGIFGFGQQDRTAMFYSRRIGLDTLGNPVPLDAGARLTGRIGAEQIGVLVLRTGDPENALDLVARLKHDIAARGYVGAIVTSQSRPGLPRDRATGGADLSLPLYVRGQNLVLAAWGAESRDAAGAAPATAWRVSVDFPNDVVDNFIGLSHIGAGFDPELGFVLENGVRRFNGHSDISPRPHALGIRRLEFELFGWERTTRVDGTPSHALYEVAPLGAQFESGDEALLLLQRLEDAPAVPFDIFRGDTLAPGDYWYDRAALQVATSAGRPVSIGATASVGDFYTGTASELDATLSLRAAPHVITNLEYDQLTARLATARFTARTARLRVDVAATPRLGGTLFGQWDDASERLTVNARLHWTPRPGSDAYLVWNSAWPSGVPGGVPWGRPARGGLVGKVVSYMRF